MVTEAGGDTRWSGPSQIIFPSSSLFQVLVRAGFGSARDEGGKAWCRDRALGTNCACTAGAN